MLHNSLFYSHILCHPCVRDMLGVSSCDSNKLATLHIAHSFCFTLILPCQGRTSYNAVDVAKFSLMYFEFSMKYVNICISIFQLIFSAIRCKYYENFVRQYSVLFLKIHILSEAMWQTSNDHTVFFPSTAKLSKQRLLNSEKPNVVDKPTLLI